MNNRFKKLNRNAKRAFVALLALALICTTSGVGTIFAEAGAVTTDEFAPANNDQPGGGSDITDDTTLPQDNDTVQDAEDSAGTDNSPSNEDDSQGDSGIPTDNTSGDTGESGTASEEGGSSGDESAVSDDANTGDEGAQENAAETEPGQDDGTDTAADSTTDTVSDTASDTESGEGQTTDGNSETVPAGDTTDDTTGNDAGTSDVTDPALNPDQDTEGVSEEGSEGTEDVPVYNYDESLLYPEDEDDDELFEEQFIPEVLYAAADVGVSAATVVYDGLPHNLVVMTDLDSSLYDVKYTVGTETFTNTIPTKTNAGTYDVTVVITSKDGTDTATKTATAVIQPKDISLTTYAFTTGENTYQFTGSPITPEIVVKDKINEQEITLSYGVDYVTAYSDNISVRAITEANPPTVTIDGTGNYTGSATLTFNIGNAMTSEVSATMYSGIYDKTAHPVCLGVNYDSAQVSTVTYSLEGDEETTVIPTITDAGTYSVVIKFYGKADSTGVFVNKSITQTAVITARDLASADIAVTMPASYAYTGAAIEPVITVMDKETRLTNGIDYTVTYTNNIQPAEAASPNAPTATITGMGNYMGTISKTFTIVDFSENIEIWYNNKSEKLDWYRKDVNISAPGYKLSTSADGEFKSKYTISDEGIAQGANLFFKNTSTGYVSPAIAVSVNIDKTKPKGVIEIGDHKSKKLNDSSDLAFITQEKKKIKITSSDKLSGVDTVEYYIGKKLITEPSAIEKAAGDDWSEYDKNSKPTLSENNANFVYARIKDVAGNVSYISAMGIINDITGPTVTSVSETLAANQGAIIVTASDNLSGVSRYYLAYYKSDQDPGSVNKDTVTGSGYSSEDGNFLIPVEGGVTYVYYAVASDRAGNVGDVYRKAGTKKSNDGTTASGGSDASGGASGSSAGGAAGGTSALAPVPNGIAGGGGQSASGAGSGSAGGSGKSSGGSGSGSGGSSSASSGSKSGQGSSASGSTVTGSQTQAGTSGTGSLANREISRKPYISEATGNVHIGEALTDSWEKIAKEIIDADEGSSIQVDMRGTGTVPVKVFEALKAKNVNVTLDMPEDFKWTINGRNISNIPVEDVDLRIVSGSRNIPSNLINELADVYPHYDFEIKHTGDFGFTATLSLNVNSANAGLYGNLFYYDRDKGELELVATSKANDNGVVSYDLDHASDYTVIVKAVSLSEAPAQAGTEEESVKALATTGTLTEYTGDAVMSTGMISGQGKFADLRNWLFMIALLSVVLGVLLLFIPGFSEERDEFYE